MTCPRSVRSHTQRQKLSQAYARNIDGQTDVEPLFAQSLAYVAQLDALAARFPFGDVETPRAGGLGALLGFTVAPRIKATKVAPRFTWYDAYM